MINEVQASVSIGFFLYSHIIWICNIMLRSRVRASLLTWSSFFRTVRSEACLRSLATLLSS